MMKMKTTTTTTHLTTAAAAVHTHTHGRFGKHIEAVISEPAVYRILSSNASHELRITRKYDFLFQRYICIIILVLQSLL